MQKHALIRLGQLEGITDFLGGEALDVMQRDHRALPGRQAINLSTDHVQRLVGDQHVVRYAGPATGRSRPVSRKALGFSEEPVGRHRRVGVADFERRERNAPRLAHAARLGSVDDDAEQPRLERRPPLEAVDPA